MNVPRSIFRQYDVRGIVETELTPELRAGFGPRVRHRRAGTGLAARPSSPWAGQPSLGPALAGGVRLGIADAGGTALDVGHAAHTRALLRASPRSSTDGGLQVTGSHNPPEFNGFKMVLGGEAFHGDEILELWEIIVAERWRSGNGPRAATAPCSGAIGTGSSRAPAGAARARGGGLRERRGQPLAVGDPPGAGGRGHAALLRVGRHLSQPSSGSHRAREPARSPGRACGAPAPSWASRSMATPTASARWTRQGAIVYGDHLLVILAETRCAGSAPAPRSSST